MYRTSAYPHLLHKFSGDTTVLRDQSPHLNNEFVISACWGPTETSIALLWCAAIFESVVPLLNLWCPWHSRRKPTESSERFPIGYHQASGKTWCNTAARVFPSFSQKMTMRHVLNIHSHSHAGCTQPTLSTGGKKSTYANEGRLHLPTKAYFPCFITLRGTKSRRKRLELAT
jgi:hypothetical protein